MELARHREEQLGGSHGHLTELGVPDAFLGALAAPTAPARNTVLRAARQHATPTGNACYQACLADARCALHAQRLTLCCCLRIHSHQQFHTPFTARAALQVVDRRHARDACKAELGVVHVPARRCEMWVWCAHKAGCDNDGVFEGTYPFHGCQLMQLAPDTAPENWDRGPTFSSFESGYITGTRQRPWLSKFSRATQGLPSTRAAACSTSTSHPAGRQALTVGMRHDWVSQ
jgi:hypothetical protein